MTPPIGLHADRPVHVETRGADKVVVKRYVAGGADAVHAQMGALWSSPFGAVRLPPGLPRPLGLNADREEVEMQFLPGEPIGSRGDLGLSVELLPEVARLLADLHGSGVRVDRRRGPAGLLRSSRRKVDELGLTAEQRARPPRLVELAGQVVDRLSVGLPPSTELVISHGDFSPRNVLLTPDGLALIDFDRLQMAAPERDISYWGAWTWVTMLTTGAQPSWQVADDLASAYRTFRPVVADPRSTSWAFHRAVALLRIAHGWSALRSAPQTAALVLGEALRLLAGGVAQQAVRVPEHQRPQVRDRIDPHRAADPEPRNLAGQQGDQGIVDSRPWVDAIDLQRDVPDIGPRGHAHQITGGGGRRGRRDRVGVQVLIDHLGEVSTGSGEGAITAAGQQDFC